MQFWGYSNDTTSSHEVEITHDDVSASRYA